MYKVLSACAKINSIKRKQMRLTLNRKNVGRQSPPAAGPGQLQLCSLVSATTNEPTERDYR